MSEKWLNEILADVGLWYLTQTTERWVRTYGDHALACYIKVFLEENNYPVTIRPAGNWTELMILRSEVK